MQPLVAVQLGIVETCLSLQPPAAAEAAEAGAERCSLFTLSSTTTDSGLGTDILSPTGRGHMTYMFEYLLSLTYLLHIYTYLLLGLIEKLDTNISDGSLIEANLDTSLETCQILSALLRTTKDSVV